MRPTLQIIADCRRAEAAQLAAARRRRAQRPCSARAAAVPCLHCSRKGSDTFSQQILCDRFIGTSYVSLMPNRALHLTAVSHKV